MHICVNIHLHTYIYTSTIRVCIRQNIFNALWLHFLHYTIFLKLSDQCILIKIPNKNFQKKCKIAHNMAKPISPPVCSQSRSYRHPPWMLFLQPGLVAVKVNAQLQYRGSPSLSPEVESPLYHYFMLSYFWFIPLFS